MAFSDCQQGIFFLRDDLPQSAHSRGKDMAHCELTGKGPVVKNLVSHSNVKTKSTAFLNVQSRRFYSQALDAFVRLKVATSTLRSVEHSGGFDGFILRQPDAVLSGRALKVKYRLKRKMRSKNEKAKK
jgi:large subunit ribosomal protein L28